MKKIVYVVLFKLLLVSIGSAEPLKTEHPAFGSIQGIVIDELGNRVTDAKVYAERIGTPEIGKIFYARVDKEGRFLLPKVPVGKNLIFAKKDDGIYPDRGLAVFAPNLKDLTRVTVEQGRVTNGAVVRLGQKGGIVFGRIVDSETGAQVLTSHIHLYRINDPTRDLSTGPDEDGRFKFVIPSFRFGLEVSASGYKVWRYQSNFSKKSREIFLRPLERLELNIRLQKTARP